jgi:streptomycin 6-kinase
MDVAARSLRRLWRPPPAGAPFASPASWAVRWRDGLERRWRAQGRPLEAAHVRAAAAALDEVVGWTGDRVVLHQDFHRGNVLRAERADWLAIDPKPLAGEPAFDARWLLRDLLAVEPRLAVPPAEALARLSAALGVESERVRLWTVGCAAENALWCSEAGEPFAADVALLRALV